MFFVAKIKQGGKNDTYLRAAVVSKHSKNKRAGEKIITAIFIMTSRLLRHVTHRGRHSIRTQVMAAS